MINQDKLKTMAQMALYEKKEGKKDFSIYSFEKGDYIRFQGLKNALQATIAFVIIVGLIVLWNMSVLINHFDVLNYKMIIIVTVVAYLCFLVFYLVISYRQSMEEYNQAHPRVRRYARKVEKMKGFYAQEDKEQRQFEKGQWHNG